MRVFAMALLMLVAGLARAEWRKVTENDAVVFYVDPPSMRQVGSFRRVWELQDLRMPDVNGELSRRSLVEYDCIGERYRVDSSSAYTGRMATGTVIVHVIESGPEAWDHVLPESVGETMLKLVCHWW